MLVFSSGCVNFDGKLSLLGLTPGEPKYTLVENLVTKVDVFPTEVYGGKNVTIYFDVSNNGNTTVSNIDLFFTDLCDFKGGKLEKKIDSLEPGEFRDWQWSIEANNVRVGRDCTLRYDMSYDTSSLAIYDISALSDDEYQRLLRKGTIEKEISLNYYKTKSPVDMDISLSKDQPILEGQEFYLYLKLRDVGGGYIDKIKSGDATIEYPNFLKFEGSDDFSGENGKLTLKNDLDFLNKETKVSTCKFKVNTGSVIRNIGQFKINIKYKYMYHKTITVKIKPS